MIELTLMDGERPRSSRICNPTAMSITLLLLSSVRSEGKNIRIQDSGNTVP